MNFSRSTALLVGGLVLGQATQGSAQLKPSRSDSAELEQHLSFLYAFFFVVKGCHEASEKLALPEYKPSLRTDTARKIVRSAEVASAEVGLDTETIWRKAAPIGEMTAVALKKNTPDNLDKCSRSGEMFRTIASRLQMSLTKVGSRRTILEKDF